MDEVIKPGMTVSAEITTNQLKDALQVPSHAVRDLNGASIIYLLRSGIPSPVTVRTGAASDGMVQITAGDIQEGEQVILNPAVLP